MAFLKKYFYFFVCNLKELERETGVEPATFALARQRSTTELFPQKEDSKNVAEIA
jgi:hypothetical protein